MLPSAHRFLRFYVLAVLLLVFNLAAPAQQEFDMLFATMAKRAHDFPREKVHLHFDNTSYYQGDTIWFSATAVTAGDNRPSLISRPLYVELLDQLGNLTKRITVRLDKGRGSGYLSLSGAMFTGYYEVRAYTKWMLAFGDNDYFSRVIPVYRKRVASTDEPRSIAAYNSLSKNMRQRPVEKTSKLSVRFYPEGGQLVQGVPSVVGFEVQSVDSGAVNTSGALYSAEGTRLTLLQTLHDGRGSFSYTPADKPAKAEFAAGGRTYSFTLPAAQQQGYILHADNRGDIVDVTVRRSSEAMNDKLAVFVFNRGVPVRFVPAEFSGLTARFRLQTDGMAAGVSRLALMNTEGRTVADRFFFVEPRDTAAMTVKTDRTEYSPNSRIGLTLTLRNTDGTPAAGVPVSVAVRDAAESDFKRYDNTLTSDLLLTSDLRGYINDPGFYFRERTARNRMLLDQLLLVRGWRRYSTYEEGTLKPLTPRYKPEQTLYLSGQVKSLTGSPQPGIGISFIVGEDSTKSVGMTVADGEGYFSVPVDGFEGDVPTVIQTRRQGKKVNRWTRVSLFRRFEPQLRAYDYAELHPRWQSPWQHGTPPADLEGAYTDSLLATADHVIGNTTVTAKRKRRNSLYNTEMFERDIIGSYNLKDYVERRADEGKPVYNLAYMLEDLDPDFKADSSNVVTYKAHNVLFLVNGKRMEFEKLRDSYNQMENMLMYGEVRGSEIMVSEIDSVTYRKKEKAATDIWSGFTLTDDSLAKNMSDYVLICSIKMSPGWTEEKFYDPRRGIRQTFIQGYEAPAECYEPDYSSAPPVFPDKRRTLYWNPALTTDSNGVARLDCWNNSSGTTLTVSAEALSNGTPASVLFNSY